MSLWESIKSWFRSESADARAWSDDVQRDVSANLDRREADLRATPAEKMERLQDQIAGNSDTFDEIRGRVESVGPDPEDSGGDVMLPDQLSSDDQD